MCSVDPNKEFDEPRVKNLNLLFIYFWKRILKVTWYEGF